MLFVRTVTPSGGTEFSAGNFQWRYEVGNVIEAHTTTGQNAGIGEAWDENWEWCGKGLHGLLNGQGDHVHLMWHEAAIWLVVEADASKVVSSSIHGNWKYRFEEATVRYAGDRKGMFGYLRGRLSSDGIDIRSIPVVAATYDEPDVYWKQYNGGAGSYIDVGKYSNVVVGYRSFAKAKDGSTVAVGNQSFGEVGANAALIGTMECHLVCGTGSSITGLHRCNVTADDHCTVTVGDLFQVKVRSDCNVAAKTYGRVDAGENCRIEVGDYNQIFVGDNAAVTCGLNCLVHVNSTDSIFRGRTGTIFQVKLPDGTIRQGEVRHLELKTNVFYEYNTNTGQFEEI